jgi:UDP-2,3-diacylglucosamine pyrophosphatase LpxH
MRLKLLAISDTHLGEETSLLSFPHGRQHLWQTLRTLFDSDERLEVEKLLLLGDIPDRTLSSTSQIITHTNGFIQMIGSAAKVREGIFIPGNHDHTLWTNYRKLRYGKDNRYGITGPVGDMLVKQGQRADEHESASELLSIFLGYPAGSSWRKIEEERNFDFVIANPLYATEINGRSYVFTHGTHFRKDVTLPEWIKRLADYLELDEVFGDIELESDCDVTRADSLETLEKIVSPFVDSLWPSSKNNPTSRSDQLWYLLTTLSNKFGKKRRIPPESKLFSRSALPRVPKKRMARLTIDDRPKHDSLKRWQEHFLPYMSKYLAEYELPVDKLTFVYGDTHDGGFGELPLETGGRVRIYNCGGWVVLNKEDHPPCHLFAVGEDGNEYLLDVSYKGVEVEGDSLLEIASRDAENRQRNTSRVLRFLLKMLPFD